ncbi:MAG: diguanylate cyclase [Spirochaetes bacterium]|nr:diguanylate cyclase [Spirochaetota bacterium]
MDNYRVLIVEDEALIAQDISVTLQNFGYQVVDTVATAEESFEAVKEKKPDVVLMDIILKGDIDGIQAAEKIRTEHNIPIIFLTTYSEGSIIERATTQIPYGYILKPFRGKELNIVMELTRHRHRFEQYLHEKNQMLTRELIRSRDIEKRLEEISLVDELTGVYNRRGFYHLARQQFDIAKRTGKSMLLAFFDIDQMKNINDVFGHAAGDNAIRATTGLLKNIFRASDIVSRWGGDEFVVLMINAECTDIAPIEKRIRLNVNDYNKTAEHQYMLSMSWGIVKFEPASPVELDELIARADEAMYRNKLHARM